jgi:hypothetical protein
MATGGAMTLITLATAALPAIFAGLVVVRLLNGQIRTHGLLIGPSGAIELERVQAFVIAFVVPLAYAIDVIVAVRTQGILQSLPDTQDWMLIAVAGSQSIYLGGKVARLAARREVTRSH